MRVNANQIEALLAVGHKVYTYRGGTRIYYLDPASLNASSETANRVDYTTHEVIEKNATFRDTGNYWYDTNFEELLEAKFPEINKQHEIAQNNIKAFERLKSTIPERFI